MHLGLQNLEPLKKSSLYTDGTCSRYRSKGTNASKHMRKCMSCNDELPMRREPGKHILCEEPAVLKLILAFQSMEVLGFFLSETYQVFIQAEIF